MKFSVATSLLLIIALLALFQVTECQPIAENEALVASDDLTTSGQEVDGQTDEEERRRRRRDRERRRRRREGKCLERGRWVPC
ncbi:hypothetical protein BKA69DRAFT_1046019 [Paraphysoderma sedebokerense]|nr:hypothetical protein BKA69DRAFT_1046019 [Paraphysoderma sedebokerense]